MLPSVFGSGGFKKDKIIYQEFHTLEFSLRYGALVERKQSVVYSGILTLVVPHG